MTYPEGAFEHATLAVGLRGRPGLRGDDQRRLREVVVEGREYLAGVGRVEHGQRDAGRAGDDLRCERGTAHAGERDPGDTGRGQGRPESEDLRDERA